MNKRVTLLLLITILNLTACDEDGASADTPLQPYTDFFTPIPAAAVFPADNTFSEAKRTLGEFLFWDPILSGRMNVSCASCHHPEHGWADGRALSIGIDGEGLGPDRSGEMQTEFHSPSILNVAFTGLEEGSEPGEDFVSGAYFWDLRADTLEDQALEPIRSEVEMRSSDFLEEEIMIEVVGRLSLIPEYQELFASAFEGEDPIDEQNIARALATYQRTLITERTRFDDFLDGEEATLTAAEIIGLNKFINGGCTDCHSGPMLADNEIEADMPVQTDKPAVRTPSLRNVELTPPYFHDGSLATLRDAVAFYEERDDLGVTLEDDDFDDILRFLVVLTDSNFSQQIPSYVPSQLPVGGDI